MGQRSAIIRSLAIIRLGQLICGLLLLLMLCTTAAAESSVWKAQKGSSIVYLGGTIHLLRQADYPLPPEFDKAFQAADLVLFETDIGLLNDPAIQQQLLQKAMYSDGSTIDKHLSARVYAELSSYTAVNGIPLQQLSRFRPAMLMTVLTMTELKKLGIIEDGVDSHYFALAKKNHKPVKGLETVAEQLEYLISCADGHEDEFVSYSLKDLQETDGLLELLTAAWRKGDDAKIDRLMTVEMKTAAPYVYQKLLLDRNKNWLPLILAEQKPLKTLFVLVGVGHLVGPDGLVESLRKSGYQVTKVQ